MKPRKTLNGATPKRLCYDYKQGKKMKQEVKYYISVKTQKQKKQWHEKTTQDSRMTKSKA